MALSKNKNRSLRTTLIVLFVLLALVPSVAFSVTITLASFEQSYRLTTDQFNSLADTKITGIERLISNGEDVLSLTLSDTRQYPRMLETVRLVDARLAPIQQMNDYLQQKLDGQSIFTDMFVYTRTGEVRASTKADLIGTFISSEPYYLNSLESAYIQAPYFDRQNRMVMLVTDVIRDERDNILGVIVGQVDTQLLIDLMATGSSLGETGETYLVAAQDSILLTPARLSGIEPGDPLANAGIERALQGSSGADRYTNYHNETVIGVYRWVPQLDAAMLLEISQTEASGVLSQVLIISIIVAVIVALGAFGLGLATTRWLVRPLRELSRVASAIAQGNYSQRATVTRNNEIGDLAHSFNSMADQLSGLINTLEQRVREQTRDLRVSAEVSRQVTTLLSPNDLLSRIAELTREAFDLYYVGVFVRDKDTLYLRAATGDAGQEMLATNKQFAIESQKGLVPLAARQQHPVLENDIYKSQQHAINPLLPKTHAEIALPLLFGDHVIGVLDLQSDIVNKFNERNIEVFVTLADQLSVALRNAELFAQTELALADAEQANNVKSAFLASMSHELRTPLNAVINFTKFVAKGDLGPVNEEQEEILYEVVDSAKHLLNLINDVLDMSKIEAGSLSLFVTDDVNVKEIIDRVVATGKGLLQDKPVTIEERIEALPLIRGDRQRIMQILLNIMSNACKFTEEGKITVKAYQNAGNVVISVSDTGPGIAPDDQNAVFEAFKQTSSGLRQLGGTGLGMPISRSLAEAHGGQLELLSQAGEGATFTVTLPVKSETLIPLIS